MELRQKTVEVPRAELLQEQVLEQQEHWSAMVANQITGQINDQVGRIIIAERMFSAIGESKHGRTNLTYRIAREAVLSGGNSIMHQIGNELRVHDSAYTVMQNLIASSTNAAQRAFAQWYRVPTSYYPPNETPGFKAYQAWEASQKNFPPEDRTHDFVPIMDGALLRIYSSETRDQFEVVRSARYRQMVPEDVDDIVDSYRKAMLDESTLRLLFPEFCHGSIQACVAQFREKMNKGIFIHDLDPDEMRKELKEGLTDLPGMSLIGRVLEAEDGKKLAWLTSKHPQNKSPKSLSSHERQLKQQRITEWKDGVRRFLRKGVTGNKLEFDKHVEEEVNLQSLLRSWNAIELFQDIRSHYPFGADRLMALFLEEIQLSNPDLKYVMAYRLHNLKMYPEPPYYPYVLKEGHFSMRNDKSFNAFSSRWKFRPVAKEFNPRGPYATRPGIVTDQGSALQLNPLWEHMLGQMGESAQASRDHWRGIQIDHGDLSHDSVTNSKFQLYSLCSVVKT